MVDILESYGLLLSRHWSAQLNGYFSIDQSHLWLPSNDQQCKIKIERERYMKYTITHLDDLNEPTIFINSILGNNSFDSFFGNFTTETLPYSNVSDQYELLECTRIPISICTKLNNNNCNIDVNKNVWSLHFDGSKTNERVVVCCILKDPLGNKFLIACRLEFESINNVVEYEDPMQGLKKVIDLNVKNLKVIGASKNITKQV